MYRINPEITVRKIGDEIFIYDRNRSFIHTFNETALFLWKELEKNSSSDEIIQRIAEEYDVEIDVAKQDYKEFCSILESKQIILKTAQ